MDCADRTEIHAGGPFNAKVYRCTAPDGTVFVEKDFSSCAWIVRNTLGRFFAAREIRMLRTLAPTGIAPLPLLRSGPFAFSETFCAGESLRMFAHAGTKPHPGRPDSGVPVSFFDELEAGVARFHALGVVHLDLHNERNVMVTPDFHPCVIDWQSAVRTAAMPRFLRRRLEAVDTMGLLKFRNAFHPETLTDEQRRHLKISRGIRKFLWPPRVHLKSE